MIIPPLQQDAVWSATYETSSFLQTVSNLVSPVNTKTISTLDKSKMAAPSINEGISSSSPDTRPINTREVSGLQPNTSHSLPDEGMPPMTIHKVELKAPMFFRTSLIPKTLVYAFCPFISGSPFLDPFYFMCTLNIFVTPFYLLASLTQPNVQHRSYHPSSSAPTQYPFSFTDHFSWTTLETDEVTSSAT